MGFPFLHCLKKRFPILVDELDYLLRGLRGKRSVSVRVLESAPEVLVPPPLVKTEEPLPHVVVSQVI
ncbi:MAG: hypothetical protein ACFFAS_01445 [Promethearchaeota archaeon]